MNEHGGGGDDPGEVPIHVRRVVVAGGAFDSFNEVHCYLRSSSIPVAECERCPGYAGNEVDLYHHRNYLLCRRLTPEAARGVPPAPRASLRRRLVPPATPGERTTVSEIMTSDVWCGREDLDLPTLQRLIVERSIGGVPIVDEAGRPIGIVTLSDLTRHAGEDKRAGQIMSRLMFVLPDSASVSQAAALMALEHVHRIPIVDDDGHLAGIVSSLDLLAWLARHDGYVLPR
jgi:CBS domain-containing protein